MGTAAGEAPAAEEEEAAEPVMVDWPYGALDTVEASTFYLDVARAGIQYGPHFKMVHKRHIEGKQVVLRWGEPASLHGFLTRQHPMKDADCLVINTCFTAE